MGQYDGQGGADQQGLGPSIGPVVGKDLSGTGAVDDGHVDGTGYRPEDGQDE